MLPLFEFLENFIEFTRTDNADALINFELLPSLFFGDKIVRFAFDRGHEKLVIN